MYSISDANKAWEIVNERIPDPLVIVLAGDYVYHEGQLVNWTIEYGAIATVDGHPVVIKRPVSHGVYEWDYNYGPDNLEAFKEELFEQEYARIHKEKWNNTQWDQRAPEEIVEQEGITLEPALPTQAECHSQWIADDLYFRCGFGRARLPLKTMLKCICQQETCPHNPARMPLTWKERWLEDAENYKNGEAARELMQDLVDQAAKSGVK